MEQLIQKRFLKSREVILKETKVRYKVSSYGKSSEVSIPYENIEGELLESSSANNLLLVFSSTTFLITIATFFKLLDDPEAYKYIFLFWVLISSGLFFFYWISVEKTKKILLSNNSHIILFKYTPSEKETDEFIDTLIRYRNDYLSKKYGQIDPKLNYDSQLANLRWLNSIGVYNNEEFDEKYDELKKSDSPTRTDIGFT